MSAARARSDAWKDFERRAARMFGGERAGPLGRNGSDGDASCKVSLECKRTVRPPAARKWIEQARRQAKVEGRPWVLAVSVHNDPRPLAIVDLKWLASVVNPPKQTSACRYCGAPTQSKYQACAAHADLSGAEPL